MSGAEQLEPSLHRLGHEVDIVVTTGLRTVTRVWMGHLHIPRALRAGILMLDEHSALRLRFQDWIGLAIFAHFEADLPKK